MEKWADFIRYDENKNHFSFGGKGNWRDEYEVHSLTKSLKHINESYDESGFLAVQSIKQFFFKTLKELNVCLFDLFSDDKEYKKELAEYKDMYRLLTSPKIKAAEDEYLERMHALACKVVGKKFIGTFDKEVFGAGVFRYTTNVISTLDMCRIEFYQEGGEFTEVTYYSTNIHVFPSLADCVLTLSTAKDGVYLCFIDIVHSADSYFGIFIKSNGNLLSVNDRIDEAYKGAHARSRSGSWSEGKADKIFPYDAIFEYSDFDYSGYSHTYKIDKNMLEFSKMDRKTYIPLLLAMIVCTKMAGKIQPDDRHLVYLDSLLTVNTPLLSSNTDTLSLSVVNENALVLRTNMIDLHFDYARIMDGSAADEFSSDKETPNEYSRIVSSGDGQFFVDLYGDGFEIGPEILSTKKFLSINADEYVPEFVGSEHRLRAQAYCEIRQHLAEYVYQKMYEEYKAFGGMKAVKEWFFGQLDAHMDEIKRLAVEHYVAVIEERRENIKSDHCLPSECEEAFFICMRAENNFLSCYDINEYNDKKGKYIDMDTGAACSIFFIFQFIDFTGLENLFGSVPKIIKGWRRGGHHTYGNSILHMTDAMEAVETPFESPCSFRAEYKYDNTQTNFTFSIGFSKRGLTALCKKYGYGNVSLDKKQLAKYLPAD